MRIADYLSCGQQNAVHLRRLASTIGENPRIVRRMIEKERREGCPIVSDNLHGYWIADDPVEAQRFARSMYHRSLEIWKTAAAVVRAARHNKEVGD